MEPCQFIAYLFSTEPLQVQVEYHSDRFCLLGINDIGLADFVVAENISVAVQYSFFTAYHLTSTNSLRDLSALVLRLRSHK